MPDTGNAPDRPVFLLCHEQRLAQTKPRHGGGLPGACRRWQSTRFKYARAMVERGTA